ncbi:methyltransferase domain-containing protein [Leadbettera azotonutricia]|uniref:methyltransferase domain-containing protein n=1 Tax=Leadbettera azotonutricia TaxID=150829 RepID=UPI0002F752F8|nr:methyltransferase domain-containing protein [Leadbettera azotonutricia]
MKIEDAPLPMAFCLAVPCLEKGRGGGHLSRSAFLVKSLREKGKEACLYVPAHAEIENIPSLIQTLCPGFSPSWMHADEPRSRRWSFIILDRFCTPKKEFALWQGIAPLIGIDEGGPCRSRFDFLIDLLPLLPKAGPANLTAINLLPLPANRRPAFMQAERDNVLEGAKTPNKKPLRILISFGAEDAAGLGSAASRALGIEAPGKTPNLKERLAEYDLVITHFGLTAFEAVYARVPVLLMSPTLYHEKLARNAGFFSAGIGPESARSLEKFLSHSGFMSLAQNCEKIAARYRLDAPQGQSLADYLSAFAPLASNSRSNTVIGSIAANRPLARFPERTYRREGSLIRMDRLTLPPIEYEKDYFFGMYKKQYGKTYLEDFPNLIEMGRRRLVHIKQLLHHGKGASSSLLDIGCAYGPFLAAAKAEGFEPAGVEPAEDAARYVNEELGIPCSHGFFPAALEDEPRKVAFDAITLWYVIEHFEDPGPVLAEIHSRLKPGGILAFSTPSFTGISGRASLPNFLKNSPADHWTIWSPQTCRAFLKKHGFSLKKTVVTGHHPERFPFLGRFCAKRKGPLYSLLLLASRMFSLGDTFEAYGVKTGA